MGQCIVILASLILIYRQVRIQSYANMLQMLTGMRETWNSDKMLAYRRATCNDYNDKSKRIGMHQGELLGFFEEMGLLLKKRVVQTEFIWDTYSYFIENYWSMLEPNIRELRLSMRDNSYFENFEHLRLAVRRHSARRRCPSSDKTVAEIETFIHGEMESSLPIMSGKH
jgi:hypothetical protein